MKIELTTNFSCGHFYQNAEFSNEENLAHFGKCFHEHGHGHDYKLQACFRFQSHSSIKQQTTEFQNTLDLLREHLDHKHLNHNIPTFTQNIPTTENLAKYCLQYLKEKSPTLKIEKLTLFERADLWVEIQN